MEAVWITAALVMAVIGGWPVTSGILRLAKSKTVRAADVTGAADVDAPMSEPEAVAVEAVPDGADEVTSEGEVAVDAESQPPAAEPQVLRGGLMIGMLERAAVAVAILAGQPVAIAYVVAIKGLGRYPELKDTPAASERFIIGTLASMLWAASVAVLTKVLLL